MNMKEKYMNTIAKYALALFVMLFTQTLGQAQTYETDTPQPEDTAATLQWPATMTAALDSLLDTPLFLRSQVAILVYDLDRDAVLYDHGSLQLMRPASVMKLLTAITALDNLGRDHRFVTTLSHSGTIERDTLVPDSIADCNVLRGDLYLRGGFDPLFGGQDMQAFRMALKQRGIRRIEGNIYADVSFKDTLKWGEGWCWDDKECTLTPLLYNAKDIFMTRFLQTLDADTVSRPATYYRQPTPGNKNAIHLLEERSHTVSQMITHMMKESDNLYAESLFYQLGATDNMPYASARKSAEKEYNLIRKLGLNPDAYSVADGSGLSLYNYLTPQLVVRLLRHAWQRPDILATLYPALPVAGIDGTLKKRMNGTPAQENVHAKTGTLRKVSTLAGYATAANGTHLAFCIFNQGILNANEGRDFQDRVCIQLVK